MKRIWNWLSSLKLTVWTLALLIGIFFIGAYLMPLYPKEHQGMNAMPLLHWWIKTGKHFITVNVWLPLAMLLLAVLALNALVCTVRAFRWGRSIWAHVTHVGFLFILLAHLISASTGFKDKGIVLPRGHAVEVPRLNIKLVLNRIHYLPYPGGMPKDYSADLTIIAGNDEIQKNIGPNRPAFYQGIPIYLQDFRFQPIPYVVCEIAHDPGALVALVGSVIFLIGSIPLFFLSSKEN